MDSGFFDLSEEQRLVRETALNFAKEEVMPLAVKIDREHYFPKELVPKLGSLGFLGVNVPEEYGGAGLDYLSYALIIEELARACASTSVIVSAHNSLCIWPLITYGSKEQKERYLPKLASGEMLGAFALSEPGTGSDAARQTCASRKEGKEWVLNGVKNWVTNGPVADLAVVFTMEKPELGHKGINCVLVELKNTAGVEVGKPEDKLGICGSPTASISFDGVRLSAEQMLGSAGDGFRIAMSTLDGGRIGIAAQAVGIARAALEESLDYAEERHAFGVRIAEHQSIQNYLADMSCRINSSRLLAHYASRLKDSGRSYTREAAEAKLTASETAVYCALQAIQIHGGYGYVKDYPVERFLRDAKITEIYEGTSEIQRLVIASKLRRRK